MATLLIKPILTEAWQKVKGSKRPFFAVFIALGILQLLVRAMEHSLQYGFFHGNLFIVLGCALVGLFFSTPLFAGLAMLGVIKARDEHINVKQGFAYFNKILPLFFSEILLTTTFFITMFCVTFGMLTLLHILHLHKFLLIVSFGVDLSILICALFFIGLICLFQFIFILVIDQNKTPWQAYKTSIKMAWLHLKVLYKVQLLIALFNLLSIATVGIGLLWVIPFSQIIHGILYREINATFHSTILSAAPEKVKH